MKMVDDRNDDAALDALFHASQSKPPEMTAEFLQRLQADMDASLPQAAPVTTPAPTPIFGNLRTWFAASGLSGAAVLGVWIGFVMPDIVNTVAVADDQVALYTFLPGADLTTPALGE